ncbi:MAG: DUF4394 domain-containing protein [Saprospiraceae bacterium]|nr:DUF4394 domain-containing protein [Saprospiraceae bacterium]
MSKLFTPLSKLVLGATLVALPFLGNHLNAQTIYALSGNNLVSFMANAPANLLDSRLISGVAMGQEIVGLDFRPNTGELFVLGYNASNGQARLYTLNRNTAVATPVGAAAFMLNPNMGMVGFDFNPTVDRIRVTGSDGSNFRLNPINGTLAATDGDLAFAAADPNAAAMPNIGAVAYTNSYVGATATTLYNYDVALNVLTTQIPPNNGTLNTIGTSGIMVNSTNSMVDMDITFDAAANMNRAFLVANVGTSSTSSLFGINLMTGQTTFVGDLGIPVSDIAVLIDRTIPATISGQIVWALAANNFLLSFDSGMPGIVRNIVPLSGIAAGQTVVGMDFRPATGELYALGYNAMTGEGRLYTLNLASGAATPIGPASFILKPNMGKVGFDFNPTVDRIRVTGSDNSNFRLHPVTGALVATDGNLVFAAADINAGKDPSIGTVAYTNSFNGATTTTLYNFDDSLSVLTTQIPPNDGVLNTVGTTGIAINLADATADMDIFYNPFNGSNVAYLAANPGTSSNDNLYRLDLATGAATLIGRIGNGIAIRDIAVVIQPIETACDAKTINCMKYEVLTVTKDGSGNKTYRIRVTNNCADKLFYTAFQLPKGVVAKGPANNSTYTSPAGRSYEVRNPNFSPFYSIRFKETGSDGIANGQTDIFEYTLPSVANPSYIQVISRVGNSGYHSAYLNVFNCTVGTSSLDDDGSADDRSDGAAALQEEKDVRIYPNPTSGAVFADLTDWAGSQLQIRAMNAQGQEVMNYTVNGLDFDQIVFPESLADGLYFIEFSSTNGDRLVKRVVLRR